MTEVNDENVDIMINEEADVFLIGRLIQMNFNMVLDIFICWRYKYISNYNIR